MEDEQIFAYIRNGADEKLLVINNFYGSETAFELPENLTFEGYHSEILLSNYEDSPKEFKRVLLRPYESIVYHLKNREKVKRTMGDNLSFFLYNWVYIESKIGDGN